MQEGAKFYGFDCDGSYKVLTEVEAKHWIVGLRLRVVLHFSKVMDFSFSYKKRTLILSSLFYLFTGRKSSIG